MLLGLIAIAVSGCRHRPPAAEKTRTAPAVERKPLPIKPVTTPLACVKGGTVYVMDGEGNHQRRLAAPGTAVPESLCWSPDTKRLAFWTVDASRDRVAGPFHLCVADVEAGAEPAVLYTSDPGLGGDLPAFSPDGKEIYASVYGGRDDRGMAAGGLHAVEFSKNLGLLRFAGDGGKPHPLVERPGDRGPLRWPDVSPDGKQLVAIGGQDLGHGYLALLDLATRETREYRETAATFARWNPRYVRVAYFAPGNNGQRDLRVWEPAKLKTVTVAADLSPLATFCWSPGGQSLAYTNESSYAIRRERNGKWAPEPLRRISVGGALFRWPTFSPDGRAAIYEFHQVRDGESVLKRDAMDVSVTATDILPGAVRPLFAGSR